MIDKESSKNKIVFGAIIGGLIGGTAYYLLSRKDSPKPILNKVSDALSDLGEELDNSEILNSGRMADEIEKSASKDNNAVDDALTLITSGLSLWNKIKRGN